MLLDSSNSDHTNARYDIIVADPVATITHNSGTNTVWRKDGNNTVENHCDPIAGIESLLNEYFGKTARHQAASHALSYLPFKVGALGYFAYDLGRSFETLPSQAQDCYNASDMAIGIYTWSIIKDNKEGLFYLCTLANDQAPTKSFIKDLVNKSVECNTFSLTSPWNSNLSKAKYDEKIAHIHQYLRAGDCYQVNLAQRFQASFTGDPWHAYCQLRKVNKAPFSAFIRMHESTVLSISPERFLSVKDKQVESKPIKGTRPRGETEAEDAAQIYALRHSEKDRAENLMIVDLLRNDMSKSCQPGSINVPEMFYIESFAAVHHLVTTVKGKLQNNTHPLKVLRNAFPGGSITGTPKIRAMEIIDELEPHRRSIYCGSIGYIGINEDMDTSICIRTLLCENDTLFCWAGGGIVMDSNAASEYQESFDKVSRILPVLASLA